MAYVCFDVFDDEASGMRISTQEEQGQSIANSSGAGTSISAPVHATPCQLSPHKPMCIYSLNTHTAVLPPRVAALKNKAVNADSTCAGAGQGSKTQGRGMVNFASQPNSLGMMTPVQRHSRQAIIYHCFRKLGLCLSCLGMTSVQPCCRTPHLQPLS